MALIYTKKRDEQESNIADPWNVYGVSFGKDAKVDSEKVAYEVASTCDDLPAMKKDDEQ